MLAIDMVNRYLEKTPLYVVFDTDAFSYKSMLGIMAQVSRPDVKLGTFSNKTKIIITPDEIIK